ncbi:conserved exported hypothetical protein [Candidatus Sulfopaludibacter sp. SbA4]|nr:conserved exported hypothetical protein [Candidatus Sulfopaludibacter sp. SbA4]
MKVRYCCLAAAVLLSSGCGKEERMEAIRFDKLLTQKKAAFAESNAQEKEFISGVRGWCEAMTSGGAGLGTQLAQNEAVAQDLAKSAASVSAQVGQVRQAVYDLPIQKEFTQGVRNTLIGELTRRQRLLQDIRSALQESAAAFDGFRQSRDYKGDTYPAGIDKLTRILGSYKEPGDAVTEAVTALTEKYSIKDADLGT